MKPTSTTIRMVLIVTALSLLAGNARAQATYGTLSGSVRHRDTPLSGVSVAISSTSLQGLRFTSTNLRGDYHFPALPPGDYLVTFSMEGMQTVTRMARVALASAQRLDVSLQPLAVAEALTVSVSDFEVAIPDGVETNLTSNLIEELPVGRDVQSAIDLAAGVTTNQFGQVVVGGGYAYDSLYLVNGGITNELITGQTESLFIEDAIQEITVLSGTISAELGRFSGGVVSVITKSGGNETSGSLRSSLTNPAWTARSAAGEEKPKNDLSDTWEATLGGRILRDRLWFFGAGRQFDTTPFRHFAATAETYDAERTDHRFEVKLTGQVSPRHSIVGSLVSVETGDTPACPFGCWEVGALDLNGSSRESDLLVTHYNGLVTDSAIIEAGYSTLDVKFIDSGGEHVTTDFSDPRDIALGSFGYDAAYGGVWGAPAFCRPCDGSDNRGNESWNLKTNYYRATKAMGTHNVALGYEAFATKRTSDVPISGSMLYVYAYSTPTRAGAAAEPTSLRPVISYGDLIVFSPLDSPSHGSDFATESAFINDKWDLGSKWNFNIGVRYDEADSVDARGVVISRDSAVSPRLGATYDLRGDGGVRFHASLGRYVSHLPQLIGGAGEDGGRSFYLYYYDGPTIGGPDSRLASFDVLERAFAWLLAQGWSPETPTAPQSFFGIDIIGLNRRLDGTLKSQSADEVTLGVSMQLGRKGFARVDFIDKAWEDFYVSSTTPGDTVTGDLGTVDVRTIKNCSDCLERAYKAVQVQAGYRFSDRLRAGGNYTWSEMTGNTVGEVRYAVWDDVLEYSEYHDYPQNRPVGFLPNDRTHKARLWASYDLPLGRWGRLNTSLLQRYDSGRPYSAVAAIDTKRFVTCHPCGYANPNTRQIYYFSKPGEYRWEGASSTDLAMNWEVAVSQVRLFLQGELLNLFNEQAVVGGAAGIRLLETFDPFTETPIEGVHWAKGPVFGQPVSPSSYQQPRTYRFSIGLHF